MRHAQDALPCVRRARHAGRAMRRALPGEADLRHPRPSRDRRRRADRPAGRAGRAVSPRSTISAQPVERVAALPGGGFRVETSLGTAIEAQRRHHRRRRRRVRPQSPAARRHRGVTRARASSTSSSGATISAASASSSPAAAIPRSIGRCRWPRSPAQVMVVHRRPKFRAAPESAARLQTLADAGKIELVIPYQLAGLEGERRRSSTRSSSPISTATHAAAAGRRAAAVLRPVDESRADRAMGARSRPQPHRRRSGDLRARSRRGIFAIGDIATYPGKLKLILSGFAEAAMAAHAIYPLVHPGEALHFEYSTTQGVPGR